MKQLDPGAKFNLSSAVVLVVDRSTHSSDVIVQILRNAAALLADGVLESVAAGFGALQQADHAGGEADTGGGAQRARRRNGQIAGLTSDKSVVLRILG